MTPPLFAPHKHMLTPILFLLLAACAAQWTELPNLQRNLSAASAAYSSEFDSMVLFGGSANGSNPTSTLYLYSFHQQAWREFDSLEPSPSGRMWATLTLLRETPQEVKFILLGGANAGQSIWLLTLRNENITWQLVNQTNPMVGPPLDISLHQTVNREGKLYVFGGRLNIGNAVNSMYELALHGTEATWRRILPVSPQAVWPSPRFGHGMAMRPNAVLNSLVLYGGRTGTAEILKEFWDFNFVDETWYMINGPGVFRFSLPSNNNIQERSSFALYITPTNEMVGFGGMAIYTPSTYGAVSQILYTQLNAASTKITPNCQFAFWCEPSTAAYVTRGLQPKPRYDFAWVVRNNADLVVFGGQTVENGKRMWLSDVWQLDGAALTEMKKTTASTPNFGNLNPFEGESAPAAYFACSALVLLLLALLFIRIRNRRIAAYLLATREARLERARVLLASNPGGANYGATAAFVDALPLMQFKDLVGDTQEEHGTCAICFDDYEPTTKVRILPCKHYFHPECVGEWLAKHNVCPMCKAIVDDSYALRHMSTTSSGEHDQARNASPPPTIV